MLVCVLSMQGGFVVELGWILVWRESSVILVGWEEIVLGNDVKC